MSFATRSKLYYHIIGIAIFGAKCGENIAPDGFTRITGKYNV